MLLGMAQGQVDAVTREVGHVLLYVPVVRPDEFAGRSGAGARHGPPDVQVR